MTFAAGGHSPHRRKLNVNRPERRRSDGGTDAALASAAVHNRSMERRFVQVDVFGESPYLGNPVAVVLDANGIDDAAMASIARQADKREFLTARIRGKCSV